MRHLHAILKGAPVHGMSGDDVMELLKARRWEERTGDRSVEGNPMKEASEGALRAAGSTKEGEKAGVDSLVENYRNTRALDSAGAMMSESRLEELEQMTREWHAASPYGSIACRGPVRTCTCRECTSQHVPRWSLFIPDETLACSGDGASTSATAIRTQGVGHKTGGGCPHSRTRGRARAVGWNEGRGEHVRGGCESGAKEATG